MLTLTLTKDHNLIAEVICDSHVWPLCEGQSEAADIQHYLPDPNFQYLIIKDGIHLIGLFMFKKMTEMTMEAHIRILKTYWGCGHSLRATKLFVEWLKENTICINLMTTVPSNRHNVIGFCDRAGFKVCGMIKDGIIFDHELVDLLILNKILREE